MKNQINRFPSVISFHFTDTLIVPVSDVTVAGIAPSSAVISWSAQANATDYDVFVNPALQTIYNTAANGTGISISHTPESTIATVSGLVSGTEYFVSVWASTPVTSLRGDTVFTTQIPLPVKNSIYASIN